MDTFSLDKATELLKNEGREAQFAYCMQYAEGERKDPDALACLGQFYHNAEESERDLEKAEAYYREAAQGGSEIGSTKLFFLACNYMHFYPKGKTKLQLDEKMDFPLDLHKSEDLLTAYEHLGDTQMLWAVPRLFVWLGYYYEYGLSDIEENPEKAKECYKYAADRQDKKGQFHYAEIMAYGDCDCNDPESYKHYQLSANQGYVPAMLQLDRFISHQRHRDWLPNFSGWTIAWFFSFLSMLPYGILEAIASEYRTEIPQWVESGLRLTEKMGMIGLGCMTILLLMWGTAARKKWLLAMGVVLALLLPGALTEVSPTVANLLPDGLVWMSGFVGVLGLSGFGFGILHSLKVDDREGYAWILKAATTGDPDGIYKKASALFYGNGVKKNRQEAIRCYAEAAEKGSTAAKIALGHLYRFGHHVNKDYTQAYQLFHEAADAGDCDGQYMVGYCYEHGIGVAYNMEEARTWYRLGRENGSTLADKRLNKPLKPNILDYLMRRNPSYSERENEKLRIELDYTKREVTDKDRHIEYLEGQNQKKDEQIAGLSEQNRKLTDEIAGKIETGFERVEHTLDELSRQLETAKQGLTIALKENSEALPDKFSQYCKIAEAATTKKATANEDYRKQAKDTLKIKFGDTWDKLDPESQISLISARTLLAMLKDNQPKGTFDYSGIAICASSALENELTKHFFNEFIRILREKQVPKKNWPEKLIQKEKDFTLGDFRFLIKGDKEASQKEGRKNRNMCLQEILKLSHFHSDQPNKDLIYSLPGQDMSFVDLCDHIRREYRNPSAHAETLGEAKALSCCEWIMGRYDAEDKLNSTESVLILLFELLK